MVKLFCVSAILSVLVCSSLVGRDTSSGPDLHTVFFADIQSGYSIGDTSDAAIILKTQDGGTSWKSVYQTKLALYGIYFRNANAGWVVGASGIILHTSNGGRSWNAEKGGTDEDLLAVTADSSGAIFIVGKRATVLESLDNGETWRRCIVPAEVDLTNVMSLPSGELFVLGRDRLFTSTDSGSSWVTHGPYKWDTLSNLAFANEKVGLLSSGQVLRTTDGGSTLSWLPIARKGHVNQIRFTGTGIYLIVGSATTGSTVHLPGERLPSHSTILKTTDMGKNWQIVFKIKDAQTHKAWLEDLFFIGEHGWAVGAEGTLVRTENGGKSWERSQISGIVTSTPDGPVRVGERPSP